MGRPELLRAANLDLKRIDATRQPRCFYSAEDTFHEFERPDVIDARPNDPIDKFPLLGVENPKCPFRVKAERRQPTVKLFPGGKCPFRKRCDIHWITPSCENAALTMPRTIGFGMWPAL